MFMCAKKRVTVKHLQEKGPAAFLRGWDRYSKAVFLQPLFIVLYERTLLTYAIPLAAPRITPEANVNAAT